MTDTYISGSSTPFIFFESLNYLQEIYILTGSLKASHAYETFSANQGYDIWDYYRALDSNENGVVNFADDFASDAALFFEIDRFLRMYMPAVASGYDSSSLPDTLGTPYIDQLSDLQQQVSKSDEALVLQQVANSIPQSGTVQDLFGDPYENRLKYESIVFINPLVRKDSLSEEERVTVVLVDGTTREVIFQEHRSGTAREVMGEPLESKYYNFLLAAAYSIPFDQKTAFEDIKRVIRDLDTDEAETPKHLFELYAVAAGARFVGFCFGYLPSQAEVAREVSSVHMTAKDMAAVQRSLDHRIQSLAAQGEAVNAAELRTLRLLRNMAAGVEAEARPFLNRSYINYRLWGTMRPTANASSVAITSLRIISYAALIDLLYEMGSWGYHQFVPTDEMVVREHMDELFGTYASYENFNETLNKYPAIQDDFRIFYWIIKKSGVLE